LIKSKNPGGVWQMPSLPPAGAHAKHSQIEWLYK
jgi:hypothetical protein